jgi:hypothetical protein
MHGGRGIELRRRARLIRRAPPDLRAPAAALSRHGFQAGFGDELFSLPPADLACYAYAMVNREDTPRSPRSLAVGRRLPAANINFDGTKLRLEQSRPKTTTDG